MVTKRKNIGLDHILAEPREKKSYIKEGRKTMCSRKHRGEKRTITKTSCERERARINNPKTLATAEVVEVYQEGNLCAAKEGTFEGRRGINAEGFLGLN